MHQSTSPRWIQALAALAVLLGGAALLAACASLAPPRTPPRDERGLQFSHSVHMNAKMECADCHDFMAKEPLQLNHQLCSVCHIGAAPAAFDVHAAIAAPPAPPVSPAPETTPAPAANTPQDCAFCHTTPDYLVADRARRFMDEIIWSHDPHVKSGVGCEECHGEPDTKPLPTHNLMPDCMHCHATVDPKLNECSVCHKELDKDVLPKFHGTRRIQHDVPEIWIKTHGRESTVDAQYCAICHTDESYCADCHRVTKPASHTPNWERMAHGHEAIWNRQSCSVCHEEDSCQRCHMVTKPQSHTGGFGSPLNTHCVNCHYPRGETGCATCHQEIEHRQAMPSIHKLGLYPPNCALCHPGGIPTRAPHLMNSTVECRVCHQ